MCKLTIGMPVFNGENYLSAALDSILSQTFSDFELIISDNASTDQTEEICREYAAKDTRVRYYRNAVNRGAAYNFNRVFELSSAEYFKWAAHDDHIAPTFLEKCINVLEDDPTIALCHSKTRVDDFFGKESYYYLLELDGNSRHIHKRLYEIIRTEHWCFHIFGVIRTDVLRKTLLIRPHSGADKNILADIGLLGRLYEIPEYLFIRGAHPESSTSLFPDNRDLMVWYDPENKNKSSSPIVLKFQGYLQSIQRTPMSIYERLLCYSVFGLSIVGLVGRKLFRYKAPDYLMRTEEAEGIL